jgi:hypothetical protein
LIRRVPTSRSRRWPWHRSRFRRFCGGARPCSRSPPSRGRHLAASGAFDRVRCRVGRGGRRRTAAARRAAANSRCSDRGCETLAEPRCGRRSTPNGTCRGDDTAAVPCQKRRFPPRDWGRRMEPPCRRFLWGGTNTAPTGDRTCPHPDPIAAKRTVVGAAASREHLIQMLLLRLLRTKFALALLRFAWRRRGGLLGALRRAR